jgi:hypothetical protein
VLPWSSAPPNRRASKVRRKTPEINLRRPPVLDLSLPPLARLALDAGHRQAGTVVAWHRAGVHLFWTWKVRPPNPVGPSFRVKSEISSARCAARIPFGVHPASMVNCSNLASISLSQTALSKLGDFLEDHAQQLVSIDFYTVATIRFQVLYVFLVLAHAA